MGQQEIIDFLNENIGKKYSVTEISAALDIRKEAVYNNLQGIVGKGVSREFVFNKGNKANPGKYVYFIDPSGRVMDSKEEFSDKQRLIHEIDEMLRDLETVLHNLNNRMESFKREVEGYRVK